MKPMSKLNYGMLIGGGILKIWRVAQLKTLCLLKCFFDWGQNFARTSLIFKETYKCQGIVCSFFEHFSYVIQNFVATLIRALSGNGLTDWEMGPVPNKAHHPQTLILLNHLNCIKSCKSRFELIINILWFIKHSV